MSKVKHKVKQPSHEASLERLKASHGKTALFSLTLLTERYPGLLDGDTEVNGSDLIETITGMLDAAPYLKTYLTNEVKKLKGYSK